MEKSEIHSALRTTYKELAPYSKKHEHDFDRYAVSLGVICEIPNIRHLTVLDMGTGVGIIPLALRKLGIDAEGLDHNIFPESGDVRFSIPTIGDLQKLWDAQGLRVHNVDVASQDGASFVHRYDVIISEATIEHLKDPKHFFSLTKNFLNEKGYFLLSTPNVATLIKRVRFLFGKSPFWPIESFYEEGERFTGHWREYTMDELIVMAQKSGFAVCTYHTKNVLTKFKGMKHVKKNIRALARFLSSPFTNMREIHYLLV